MRVLPLLFLLVACAPATSSDVRHRAAAPVALPPLFDDIEERTFRWFWETANPANGLVPDRWPSKSFSSVAAVGFGLTAYGIGVERGWVTREQAAGRVLTTLRFFRNAPQGPQPRGVTGHKGFFYHFLDMETGERFEQVELSTIDTAIFLAGALFCQSYFDRSDEVESEIRRLAGEIYERVEWDWAVKNPPFVSMGWKPEEGLSAWSWSHFNEAALLQILAIGSPTHPIEARTWNEWTKSFEWRDFYGYPHVNFAPLFGHQYSQVWIDFRGIRDDYMRAKGIDYFENSRRATLSQRAYAIANPMQWEGYGPNVWGLTACDGPADVEREVKGVKRRFFTYAARGAAATEVRDDGTIAPTAALGSLPFAPEAVIPAVVEMYRAYGARIYARYGFLDSFNPTFRWTDVKLGHGTIDPLIGWYDLDYLGIDQGPIVAMIENYRTGLVWTVMRKNAHVRRGLERAGFRGGWLAAAPAN